VSSLYSSPLAPNSATERVRLAHGLLLDLKEPRRGLGRGSFNPLSNPSTMIKFKKNTTTKATNKRGDRRGDEDAITKSTRSSESEHANGEVSRNARDSRSSRGVRMVFDLMPQLNNNKKGISDTNGTLF